MIQIGAGAAEHGHAKGKGGDQGEGDADSRLCPRPLRLHHVVAVGVIVLAGQADDARGGHGPQVGAHQHAHVVTQHPSTTNNSDTTRMANSTVRQMSMPGAEKLKLNAAMVFRDTAASAVHRKTPNSKAFVSTARAGPTTR